MLLLFLASPFSSPVHVAQNTALSSTNRRRTRRCRSCSGWSSSPHGHLSLRHSHEGLLDGWSVGRRSPGLHRMIPPHTDASLLCYPAENDATSWNHATDDGARREYYSVALDLISDSKLYIYIDDAPSLRDRAPLATCLTHPPCSLSFCYSIAFIHCATLRQAITPLFSSFQCVNSLSAAVSRGSCSGSNSLPSRAERSRDARAAAQKQRCACRRRSIAVLRLPTDDCSRQRSTEWREWNTTQRVTCGPSGDWHSRDDQRRHSTSFATAINSSSHRRGP